MDDQTPDRRDLPSTTAPPEPPGPVTVTARPIGHQPHHGRLWWSFLASGLLFIAFGIAILFVPRTATRLLVTLLGVLLAFLGIVLLAASVTARRHLGRFGLGLVPGILLVGLGVATVVFADFVSRFFVVAWSVVAILGGAWEVAAAVMNRQAGRWWRLVRGLVLVAAGLAFVIAPTLGVAAAGVLVGMACIGVGIASLAIALATRRTGI
jgi:uncharacterized membrane protein HdeD (DUF308 family)